MDASTATILGAVVGAIAGIGGGLITTASQLRLEREKWPRMREDEISKELRSSIQTLTVKLASALHSMAWLCWKADQDWQQVTIADIDNYDMEMHRLFPDMMGMLAAIAALDKQSFQELNQRYQEVVKLDRRVGDVGLGFRKDREKNGPKLGELHEDVVKVADALPLKIADLVSERMANRAAFIHR